MPSTPAFVNKIKISAKLTYFVWVKCQFSIKINFYILYLNAGKLGLKKKISNSIEKN
jgi:hypothetical protein